MNQGVVLNQDYSLVDSFDTTTYRNWKEFMGRAIRDSERAHTGRGIWDVVLNECSNEEVAEILGEAAISDPAAHFHLSRTTLIVEKSSNTPVASASSFHYPTCGVKNSQPAITDAWIRLYPDKFPYPVEEKMKVWDRIDFLNDSFPDWEYGNTWMIDTVYTDPLHRGKGLAEAIVTYSLSKGKAAGHTRSLITCSVGNEKARRVYERCGYRLIGQGNNAACEAAVGFPGFYVLEKNL